MRAAPEKGFSKNTILIIASTAFYLVFAALVAFSGIDFSIVQVSAFSFMFSSSPSSTESLTLLRRWQKFVREVVSMGAIISG